MKKNRLLFILFFLIALSVSGAVAFAAGEPEYKTFSELNGKKIAMLTGAPFEEVIQSKVPDVKEFLYFSNVPDMKLALEGGKIDAFLLNNAIAELMANRNSTVAVFPENLGEAQFGCAFKKGSEEREKWQQAYDTITEDELNALWHKWTGAEDSIKSVPEQTWPGSNGTVKVAACDTLEPMSYVDDNGKLIGFDIELILIMAEKLDIHVEFTGMEFSALLSTVQSGKADMGVGSIVVSDERKELVDFIEYYPAAFVLVVRSAGQGKIEKSLWSDIKSSFTRTFITDGRYKMILSGLGVTVIIAITSGIIGTALGFLLVNIRYRDKKLSRGLINIYSSLITGIPVVVILMVLYYILFGAIDASAILVSIIGFAIIFGARSFGVIWNAVKAVDAGQREAALALGYSEKMTFRKIMLPQAGSIYMPLLKSQFVMLLKETSVAGYITVLDLTRVGDLIRSRTMDAFFPLISIAVIYFLLTWLLTKGIDFLEKKAKERKEKRRIPGVD